MTKARTKRAFPRHTLEGALAPAQKIQDEGGGNSFKRLLLADALGIKPSSSNYRDLLSSSYAYGLTEGTEKATDVSLTALGGQATGAEDRSGRIQALRKAALRPRVFKQFFSAYADHKVPSGQMLPKVLESDYGVHAEHASECAEIIVANGTFADIIRDIGGSPHILLDTEAITADEPPAKEEPDEEDVAPSTDRPIGDERQSAERPPPDEVPPAPPKAIFVGHGKNRGPVEKLRKILTSFQIPHKIVVEEANLGRPIPQKVKETMLQCGSAILIFTRDEKFQDADGLEIWRPSENVVFELGAASYAYENRVVIFKEKGIDFPTNFESIGYIEFEEDSIEAKTTELLKELIGFGLVKVTTTS